MQAQPSEDHPRRLGLHRPGTMMIFNYIDVLQMYFHSIVSLLSFLCCLNFLLVTSLPRDRLSQVTRRGMLTDKKSHTKPHTAGQSDVRYQRMTGLSRSPAEGAAAGRGILREQMRMKGREEVNLWELSSEMNRLLGPEESDIVRITFFITY